MGSYLEEYLETISALPLETNKSLNLMRELDERTQEHVKQNEHNMKRYLAELRKSARSKNPPDEGLLKQIEADHEAALKIAVEKTELASQTYDLIDKHIRQLDKDLVKFEAELRQREAEERKGGGNKGAASTDSPKRSSKIDRGASVRPSTMSKVESVPKTHGRSILAPVLEPTRGVFNVQADMPVDPNEPRYCVCREVSYGEMVGCDNADCPIEWFHFQCVGLTAPPKGKWLCPECRTKQRKRFG